MSIPELECAWCGQRQPNNADLREHEADHRREDIVAFRGPWRICPGCVAPKWCVEHQTCAAEFEPPLKG